MITNEELSRRKLQIRQGSERAMKLLELQKALRAGYLQKLKTLWGVVPDDCKFSLLLEFFLQPKDFKVRYAEEVHFRYQLDTRYR